LADGDLLRRFLFERWPVRGHFVRLDSSWRAMVERHDYPSPIRDALGEAMAATVLMAGTIKFDGQLTLQCQGPGPMHLLVAHCTHRHAIRGVARHRGELNGGSIAALTGGGQLTVTIENEDRTNRYQGVVPLDQPELSACLEGYFERSEQLPSKLILAANDDYAAGLLLQRMPSGASASAEEDPRSRAEAEEEWSRIQLLAATLRAEELLELPCQTLLHRLFHEDDVRLFEGQPVFFQCTCSRERVATIVRSLGVAEARDIIAEQGRVEVRCEFCNRAYAFDAVDVEQLFTSRGQPLGPQALQ